HRSSRRRILAPPPRRAAREAAVRAICPTTREQARQGRARAPIRSLPMLDSMSTGDGRSPMADEPRRGALKGPRVTAETPERDALALGLLTLAIYLATCTRDLSGDEIVFSL